MKKIFLTLLLLIIVPIKVYATEYKATVSEASTLYSYPFDIQQTDKYTKPSYSYGTYLDINITNIENIKNVTIRVKYDYNILGLLTCYELNYMGEPCGVNDRIIFHTFYEHKLKEDNLKNNLFSVHFIPIEKTPDTGTTEVKIYFENAIDKDGNEISIEPIIKTYNFKNYKEKYKITQIIPNETLKENNNPENNSEVNNPSITEKTQNIQDLKSEEDIKTENSKPNIKQENKTTIQTKENNTTQKNNQENNSSLNNNIGDNEEKAFSPNNNIDNNENNNKNSLNIDSNIKNSEAKDTTKNIAKQKKKIIKYSIIIITTISLILTFSFIILYKKKNITKK